MKDNRAERLAERFAGMETLPLEVVVQVGSARCTLGRLAELRAGDVIPLDRRIGERFELRAGDVLLARVEPVAHGDGVAVKIIDVPEDEDDDSG